MKIAHVIRRLSFADWGGTEQVVWNLAKAQIAAGHDVRIFATTALFREPSANSQQPAPNTQHPAPNTQQPVALGEQQPATANTQQPVALGAQQPATNTQQPAPNTQQPVALGEQQPAPNTQHPAPNTQQPVALGEQQPAPNTQQPATANKQQPVALGEQQPATGAQERVLQGGVPSPPISRFRPVYPWWPMPARLVAELDRKGGNPFVPGLGRALRAWKPDVIHCHAMARMAELCLRVAEKCGAKCVVSLHGGGALVPGEEAASLRAPTRGRIPWGKALDLAMGWTRRVPLDFGGIVCVGEDEADYWKKRHSHVLFLPNGVDCPLFAQAGAGQGSGGPGAVLCVARIDRQKNQMALVEWLGRHPDGRVRLVGPVTQPDYLEELKRRAAALGVSDRLALVGPLAPGSPELAAEYRGAEAFVLPSRHEPFGIAVLEAWAAGLPVAASRVGGLARLCEANPGAAFAFDPGDPASLDAALALARAPGPSRSRAIEAGRAAAARHDWRSLSAVLLEFYAATPAPA